MAITDLHELLSAMQPMLNGGVYVYCVIPHEADATGMNAIATFRETEGTTVILEEPVAAAHRLTPLFRAAWITLTVNSDLHAVGLTAAVAAALADAGISCNVVAAAHHDHLFVPADRADAAMQVLRRLQA
jgi:hypothetical protein